MQSLSENLNAWHVDVLTDVKMELEEVFSTGRAEEEAVFTKTAEEDAIFTRTAEEEAVFTRTAEEDTIFTRTAEEEAVFTRTAEEEAVFTRTAEEEAVFTRTAEEDIIFTRTAEEDAIFTRTAEEEAVFTRRAEEDGMLAGGDSTKLEVLDEADCLFHEPVSSTRRFSSRLREVFLDSIKCKVCGESFTMMTDLVDHLRINAGRHGLMSDQEIKLSPQGKPQTKSKGGQLKCGVCEKTFQSTRKLLQHKVTHSLGVIKCKVCSQTFLTLSDLQKHKQVHSKENVFDCDKCDEAFRTRSALFTHQSTLHAINPEDPVEINGNKKNACRYCDKAYKCPAHLREHERVHTNEKPFACVKCGKAFRRGSSLNHHMKVHSQNQTYPCIKCGTAFKSYFHLSRHRQFHKDRPFSCDICKKMYATKAKLSKHTSQHKKDSLICDECNKKFKSKLELSRHKRIHKKVEKRHICDVCNKSYKQASHLQKHKLSHRGTSKKPHVCRFCQKSYSKITQLNLHLQTHAKARPGKTFGKSDDISQENKYNCGICSNSFETYYRMRKHKQMHKDRPYMCDSCEETFRVRAKLRRHKQSECSDGYVCETCNKRFSTQHALQSHNIQHALERPYMCSVCHESFKTTKQLKRHMQVHMEEKILACPVCDKEFAGKSNLKRHKQICSKSIGSRSLGKFQTNRAPDLSPSKSNRSKITGADRLKCGSCKKIFKRVSDLKEHEKIHISQSNYLCNICGKAFKGKQLLRQHSKQHKKLPLKQSPRLSKQLRAHEADEGNTEMAEVHTQLANLTSLGHGNSQINLLPEFVLSSGVQVSGNLNPSIETQSFQQPSESCVQLISLNSDAPVDALNATQVLTHLGTAVVHQPEPSVSSPDMMCPFCNKVFRNSLECEVHMSSHDATQPSTSSICREALDALYSRGNPRGLTDFVYHNSDTLKNPQICNTTEKVAVENSESVSDSDIDFGLPGFSDEDDEPHVEMSCTEILNSLSSPGVPDSSRNDLMVVHQLLPRMKKCQLLLQKITLFPCDVCNKSFQSQVLLDQHRTSHINNDREQPSRESPEHQAVLNADSTSFPSTTELNKRTCGICSKSFQNNYSLQRHMQSHTKTKPHRCDKCGRTFKHKYHVKEHQRSSCTFRGDSGKNRKLFKCNICSKGFISSLVLKAHQRAHSDKNLHECDRCGRVFYRGHMKTHQRDSCKGTKTGTICTHVSKQTSVNDSNKDNDKMEEHMEKRALKGSFQCEICKKKFNQKLSLQGHLIKHSDKSRFECDRCNRTYKYKYHMQEHQMTSCRGPIVGTECIPEQENSRDSRQARSIDATGEVEVHQRPNEGTFLPPESGEANDDPIPADTTDDQSKSHVEPNNSTITEPDVRTPTLRQEKKRQAAQTTAATYKKTQQLLKCRICSEEFLGSFSLEMHFMSHADTHPHKCDKCERRYKHKHHMKAHQKDSCKGAKDETAFSTARKGSAGESRTQKDVVHDSNVNNDGMDKRIEKNARQGKNVEATDVVEFHQTESCQGPKEGTLLPPEPGEASDNHISSDSTDDQSESLREPKDSTIPVPDLRIPTLRKEKREQAARTTADTNKKTQQLLKCRICSEEFSNSFSLEMHFMSHADTHPHKCDKCERRYKHKHHMKAHQKDSCKGAKDETAFSTARKGSAGESRTQKDVVHDSNVNNDGMDKRIEKNARLLKCRICSEEFSNSFSLEMHFMSHADTHPHKCDKCGRRYKHKHHMKAHQRDSCKGVKDETAFLTARKSAGEPRKEKDRTFKERCELNRHRLKYHGNKTVDLDSEDANENFLNEASEDFEQSNGETSDGSKRMSTKLQGRSCKRNGTANVKLFQRRALERKASTNGRMNPSAHQCEVCSKEFDKRRSLVKHAKSHADDRPYSCKACGKSYQHVHLLRHHQAYACRKSKHAEKKPQQDEVNLPVKCQCCFKSFHNAWELERHENTHFPDKKYTCGCGQAFKQKYELERHRDKHHCAGNTTNMTYIKLVQCEVCLKKIFKSQLGEHMKCHSEEHPFKCNGCGKRYTQKDHMERHQAKSCKKVPIVMVCTDKRPYKCDMCKADFSKQSMLMKHQYKVHNVGTPGTKYQLKCQLCPKTFNFEHHLKRHKNAHLRRGEATHKCVCGKNFKRQLMLWRHLSQDHVTPRLHLCNICDQMFSSGKFLRCHMRKQHDNRPFKCHKCSNTFLESKHLKDHHGVHKSKRRFKCGSCRRDFTKRSKLVSHELSHNNHTDTASCELCGKRFKGKQSLSRHKLMYHPGDYLCRDQEYMRSKPNIKCGLCGKAFWQQSSLVKHSNRTHHKLIPYTCVPCNKTFLTFSEMKAHEVEHSNFTCKICDARLENLYRLRNHCLLHTRNKNFICEICGKSSTNKKGLKLHQLRHIGKSLFICEICNGGFKSKADLDAHVNTHNLDKVYVCDVCGTLTSSHLTLMNHMKSHGGDKNLECKTCGKGFRFKRYLLAHSKIHNKGAQGHNCTVCGKSFRRKCFLTMHLHSHQDKRRTCEICNKVFKKASYLTTHMLVHNNVKPYSCKFCDRTFFKLNVRNQHHNVHTKEKPYKCDVCGDCFAATGTLYRHKKAHEKKNSKWERDRLAKEEPKERRAKSSVKDAPKKRKQKAKR